MRRSFRAGILLLIVLAGAAPVAAQPWWMEDVTAVDIQAESAVLQVTIDRYPGSAEDAVLYFEYRRDGSDRWKTTTSASLRELAVNEITVTGLQSATTYEFRAVVEDRSRTYRSDIETFSTTDSAGGSLVDLGALADAIDRLAQAITDFSGGQTLVDILHDLFFEPFRRLGKALLDIFVEVLTTTPDVHPNEAVSEIHQVSLLAAIAFATLALMTAGLLFMWEPLLGYEYRHIRPILGQLIVALGFALVSLQLLQLTVEFTNVVTDAFWPDGSVFALTQYLGLTTGLVLVWLINATLLLAVVVMFVIRDVYILFVAAISPLIAIAWAASPYTKKYASAFISGYFVALAMAPLDVLVLRFALALFQDGTMPVPVRWVLGTAALVLLILIPVQLYGASGAIVGMSYAVAGKVGRGVRSGARRRNGQQDDRDAGIDDETYFYDEESGRYRRTPPAAQRTSAFRGGRR